ncbi:alpha-1,6-glucosidase domain-containing protein [Roseateles oligotrophus]|uniref:DUF3372 domain-containing protein n=1 Tax=Roseateles oligotrophus TaxID=1769250 RepID=A0ABT2YLP2_9BURK|nr:alpha-1,6-glucosidase domain-containing protein [Roseateles oligotrophus]MCV2370846.1 DUF3372 domain-containing protein [Roseateles oligotrophus]
MVSKHMGLRRGILGLLLGMAVSQVQALEACDGAAFASLLHPQLQADGPALAAQAYWLNRRLIQWPGAGLGTEREPAARVKLYYSGHAALQVDAKRVVSGADASLSLEPSTSELPADLARRFKFIAAGPRWQVRAADVARLPDLHRAQVWLVQEGPDGVVQALTGLQAAGALDDLYQTAEQVADLGVTAPGPIRSGYTGFKLWAPTAQQVTLCRYPNGSDRATAQEPLKRDASSGVWQTRLSGDLSGQYYNYLVDVFVPGLGVVRNRVTDPYSVSLTTDSKRSFVANLQSPALKPSAWDSTPRPQRVKTSTDMVIYELHVRDFSISDASVPPAMRGKYKAFTPFSPAGSAGMRHLQALSKAGLTDVHLLPVFDIASIPEAGCAQPVVPRAAADSPLQQAAVMAVAAEDCFNWGYDPFHYSAPEGSYASDAAKAERRVIEFRQMVQALHRANLRVGMDVVYNHTAAAGQHEKSVLDRIVPGYYQRLNARGEPERSTCCDNTATEHRMMAKLMIDSVAMWAREYKIDSFRFDLMAHQPRAVMETLQKRVNQAAGRPVQLIGEGWNFGEVANGARFVQASQLSLNGSGIGTFSDRGRDAARGGSAGDGGAAVMQNQGWLNGLVYAPNASAAQRPAADLLQAADLIRVGLAGSLRDFELQTWSGPTRRLADIAYGDQPAGYVSQPGEVVNYVDNHDNQTLFDINVLKLPRGTSARERAQVQVLGLALTAFSQGVAYFHAGVDVLRSKSLDRNSYDSGDWFNRLDWSYLDNGFGAGLPPKLDNGDQYPLLAPLLADAAIKPAPADIAWTRDAFLDLLKIRASSSLFRLPTAAAVQQRLRFLNTGPTQNPRVVVASLDGQGWPGAGFGQLLYFINVDPVAQSIELPTEAAKSFGLHPVHLSADAADKRIAAEARLDTDTGRFTLPGRSALVFVRP